MIVTADSGNDQTQSYFENIIKPGTISFGLCFSGY